MALSSVQPLNGLRVLRISRLAAANTNERKTRLQKSILKIGTLNLGTMTGKGRELADKMERKKVDILCAQDWRRI